MSSYDFLGFRDGYEYLGLSDAHFYRLIVQYKVPYYEVSHGRIFLMENLERLKEAHLNKSKPRFLRPKLDILGYQDAHKYLNLSHPRFLRLMRKYEIPFQTVSSGRLFFKADLDNFQKSRAKFMKHCQNK